MPRIDNDNQEKWILRRIRIGDCAEFKVIESDYYNRKLWKLAKVIRICIYMRKIHGHYEKRIGVVEIDGAVGLIEFKEFLTKGAAIIYVIRKYPPKSYIYYYTKPKKHKH